MHLFQPSAGGLGAGNLVQALEDAGYLAPRPVLAAPSGVNMGAEGVVVIDNYAPLLAQDPALVFVARASGDVVGVVRVADEVRFTAGAVGPGGGMLEVVVEVFAEGRLFHGAAVSVPVVFVPYVAGESVAFTLAADWSDDVEDAHYTSAEDQDAGAGDWVALAVLLTLSGLAGTVEAGTTAESLVLSGRPVSAGDWLFLGESGEALTMGQAGEVVGGGPSGDILGDGSTLSLFPLRTDALDILEGTTATAGSAATFVGAFVDMVGGDYNGVVIEPLAGLGTDWTIRFEFQTGEASHKHLFGVGLDNVAGAILISVEPGRFAIYGHTLWADYNLGARDADWHAVTLVQSGGNTTAYFDNTQAAQVVPALASDKPFRIGSLYESNPQYAANANFRNVAIFDRALTAGEVATANGYNYGAVGNPLLTTPVPTSPDANLTDANAATSSASPGGFWYLDGPGRLVFDLGEAKSVAFVGFEDAGSSVGNINSFTIDVSNDASSWTTVASGTRSSAGSPTGHAVISPVPGRYISINILSNHGGSIYGGARVFLVEAGGAAVVDISSFGLGSSPAVAHVYGPSAPAVSTATGAAGAAFAYPADFLNSHAIETIADNGDGSVALTCAEVFPAAPFRSLAVAVNRSATPGNVSAVVATKQAPS